MTPPNARQVQVLPQARKPAQVRGVSLPDIPQVPDGPSVYNRIADVTTPAKVSREKGFSRMVVNFSIAGTVTSFDVRGSSIYLSADSSGGVPEGIQLWLNDLPDPIYVDTNLRLDFRRFLSNFPIRKIRVANPLSGTGVVQIIVFADEIDDQIGIQFG